MTYNGLIYVFATQEADELFVKNPYPYTRPPPLPSHLKIVIIGPPLSGKSTQAAALSERLGLKLLNPEALLREEIEKGENPELMEQMRSGKPVQINLYWQVRIL